MKRYIRSAVVNVADEDEDIKKELASSSDTSLEDLYNLIDASGDFSFIPQYAASNPSIPIENLYELSNSDKVYVRRGVALNPNTPLDILDHLSHDEDAGVRTYIATRKDIPSWLCTRLSNDSALTVRIQAIKNPEINENVLWSIINSPHCYGCDISGVLANPITTPEMLAGIVYNTTNNDKYPLLCWSDVYALLRDVRLPYESLLLLCDPIIDKYTDLSSQYINRILSDRPNGYDITAVLENIWHYGSLSNSKQIAESKDTPTEFLEYVYNNMESCDLRDVIAVNLRNRGINL